MIIKTLPVACCMQEEKQLKVDHIPGELGFDPMGLYPRHVCLHSASLMIE